MDLLISSIAHSGEMKLIEPVMNDGMNETLSQQEAVFNKRITATIEVREEEQK